jgi:hypothetical protein
MIHFATPIINDRRRTRRRRNQEEEGGSVRGNVEN